MLIFSLNELLELASNLLINQNCIDCKNPKYCLRSSALHFEQSFLIISKVNWFFAHFKFAFSLRSFITLTVLPTHYLSKIQLTKIAILQTLFKIGQFLAPPDVFICANPFWKKNSKKLVTLRSNHNFSMYQSLQVTTRWQKQQTELSSVFQQCWKNKLLKKFSSLFKTREKKKNLVSFFVTLTPLLSTILALPFLTFGSRRSDSVVTSGGHQFYYSHQITFCGYHWFEKQQKSILSAHCSNW